MTTSKALSATGTLPPLDQFVLPLGKSLLIWDERTFNLVEKGFNTRRIADIIRRNIIEKADLIGYNSKAS